MYTKCQKIRWDGLKKALSFFPWLWPFSVWHLIWHFDEKKVHSISKSGLYQTLFQSLKKKSKVSFWDISQNLLIQNWQSIEDSVVSSIKNFSPNFCKVWHLFRAVKLFDGYEKLLKSAVALQLIWRQSYIKTF